MKSKKETQEEPEIARLSAIDEDVLTVLLGRRGTCAASLV